MRLAVTPSPVLSAIAIFASIFSTGHTSDQRHGTASANIIEFSGIKFVSDSGQTPAAYIEATGHSYCVTSLMMDASNRVSWNAAPDSLAEIDRSPFVVEFE